MRAAAAVLARAGIARKRTASASELSEMRAAAAVLARAGIARKRTANIIEINPLPLLQPEPPKIHIELISTRYHRNRSSLIYPYEILP